jgi:hypothetical protein
MELAAQASKGIMHDAHIGSLELSVDRCSIEFIQYSVVLLLSLAYLRAATERTPDEERVFGLGALLGLFVLQVVLRLGPICVFIPFFFQFF